MNNNFRITGGRMKDAGIFRIITAAALAVMLIGRASDAAFEFRGHGARSAAMGGAYTAVSDDAEGVWWNPAGLRLVRTIQADTSYTALYGMSELALINFSMILPTLNAGTWGMGYSSFGFSDYRETDLRLSFSSGLRDGIYFGANLKGSGVSVGGKGGSGSVFALDAGLMGNITENYSIGAAAYNINRPRLLSGPGEFLQQRYMFGLYAMPIEGIALSFDLHKVPDRQWEQRLGLELPVTGSFRLRAGVQTRPARFSFGFGADAGIFSLNYAFRNHHSLDAQHIFAMQGRFGQDPSGRSRLRLPELEYKAEPASSVTVNINTATLEELTKVPGLGPTVAGRIIEYRSQAGSFRSVRDVMRVYGFTRQMYMRFRDNLTVEVEPAAPLRVRPPEVPDIADYYDEHYADEPGPPSPVIPAEPEPEPEEPAAPETVTPAEPEPADEEAEAEEPGKPVKVININTADLEELREAGLPAALGRNLIRHRSARGDFRSWDDILRVPGMQRVYIDRLKETAVLEPSE